MTKTCSELIAKTLLKLQVDTVFGIVGIPIVEVADCLIEHGIKFIAFRNEQAASYAASAYGYLTNKPGVLLVVGGPGVVHAGAGILNAASNGWPLLVLAGSCGVDEVYKGGFQELDQVSLLNPHTKFAARTQAVEQLPMLLEKAYRLSYFGKPGPTYVDLPANIIQSTVSEATLQSVEKIQVGSPPISIAHSAAISKCAKLITSAKSPLVIIGKGSSYTNASPEITYLINRFRLPFIPTPMGKGVVSDESEFNLNSARSAALLNADVILLLGARLNWILHHGETPRFKPSAKFIEVDIHPEETKGINSLVGHIPSIVSQLSAELSNLKYQSPAIPSQISDKMIQNVLKQTAKESISTNPLKYHRVYKFIREKFSSLPTTYITEGANTMDIARVSFPIKHPKTRLDAGTNATMGCGLGYAIAAKLAQPQNIVIAIEGDSAFGFSGLELETFFRSNLPIIVVVMNNSGVYHGVDREKYVNKVLPSTALSFDTRYDLMAEGLGIRGLLVKTELDLVHSLDVALKNHKEHKSTLLNVIIDSGANTKLEFGWQNKKSKL